MSTVSPAREAAFRLLQKWEKDRAYADILFREAMDRSDMDARDRSLCGFLFYGTVENLLLIDHLISGITSVKIKKMHPSVRSILRISVYQILFCKKIPLFAVINQGVDAVARVNLQAKGMSNAILRRLSVYRDQSVDLSDLSPEEVLSIRYSHPSWLVDLFIKEIGYQGCEELLKYNNSSPSTEVRINTLKISQDAFSSRISAEGYQFIPDPIIPCMGTIEGAGAIADCKSFKEGLFTVQSKASFLAVLLADPQPGEVLVDVCAAPGGKSFAAACLMKDEGAVYARDLYEGRVNEIALGAERLELDSIRVRTWDATVPDPKLIGKADVVLVDVPCSGLGIISKKPDIRYKSAEDIEALPSLQLRILKSSSRLVKPGGRLIYSTCTLNSRENTEVINAFLSSDPGFVRENGLLPVPFQTVKGEKTLWPHIHGTDGFYFCRMKRML